MLSSFTWKDFIIAMAIIWVIYYLVIGFLYYRKELHRLFNRAKGDEEIDEYAGQEEMPITEVGNPYEEDSLEELERTVTDIKNDILVKAGFNTTKEALLTQVKERLASYGGLRQPAYQDAISEFLMDQAKELCGVAFKEGELSAAWLELLRKK